MTGPIFKLWLQKWNRELKAQHRSICLTLDNCPSHPNINDELSNIELIFLPKNTTSDIQPLDQGIIANVKYHYKAILRKKIKALTDIDSDTSALTLIKEIKIVHAVHMFSEAWDLVKPETIANCSKKAFRITEDQPESFDPLWDIPDNLEIDREAFENELISENHQIEEEFEDYMDEVEINFKEPTSTVSIISEGPEPENISTVKAMKNLKELSDWLMFRGELSKSVSLSFSEVENVLLKTKVEEKKQTSITDFFKK